MNAHEIDYRIYGEEMQYVEIELDPEEGVVAESGSFMMMDSDVKMNTIFGDGSNQEKGLLGKGLFWWSNNVNLRKAPTIIKDASVNK